MKFLVFSENINSQTWLVKSVSFSFSLYKREVKIPSSFIVLFYYTIGTSQFYLILQIALWYVFLLTLSAAFGLALIRAQANRLAITLYHIVL